MKDAWIILIVVAVVVGCTMWMSVYGVHLKLGSAEPQTPEDSSRRQTEEQQRQCSALIAAYRPALEATFEVEIRSGDSHDEWHRAVKGIGASVRNAVGDLMDPTNAVDSVLLTLRRVHNPQVEYVLLGNALPLDAPKQFDALCWEAR